MEIDRSKLTFGGSMNYILQIWGHKKTKTATVDIYHPRKNNIWNGELSEDELRPQIEETIERMKIAIKHFEEYLDGKRDSVYYWELEDEKYN